MATPDLAFGISGTENSESAAVQQEPEFKQNEEQDRNCHVHRAQNTWPEWRRRFINRL